MKRIPADVSHLLAIMSTVALLCPIPCNKRVVRDMQETAACHYINLTEQEFESRRLTSKGQQCRVTSRGAMKVLSCKCCPVRRFQALLRSYFHPFL